MYKNIGRKIKVLAEFIFGLEAGLLVVGGIILIAADEYMVTVGILVLILGPVLAWLSSFLLYGFGELIDKVCSIEQKLGRSEEKVNKTENNNEKNVELSPKSEMIGKCELCGKENISINNCVITDALGTRYRKLCDECKKRNNAEII